MEPEGCGTGPVGAVSSYRAEPRPDLSPYFSSGHDARAPRPDIGGRRREAAPRSRRDDAGRRAAATLEARALAQGLAATVLSPEHGDFNDDLAALGPPTLAAQLGPLLGPGP